MMLTYGGTNSYVHNGYQGYTYNPSYVSYIELDNLVIEVTDNTGATYYIEDENDIGYYPYSNNDPAVAAGATYLGGQGGAPFYDCNYRAQTYNPWRFGTAMQNTFSSYTLWPSIGNAYGVTNTYPEEFGFRLGEGDTPEPIGVSFYPFFSWGWDDSIMGRTGWGGPTQNPTEP